MSLYILRQNLFSFRSLPHPTFEWCNISFINALVRYFFFRIFTFFVINGLIFRNAVKNANVKLFIFASSKARLTDYARSESVLSPFHKWAKTNPCRTSHPTVSERDTESLNSDPEGHHSEITYQTCMYWSVSDVRLRDDLKSSWSTALRLMACYTKANSRYFWLVAFWNFRAFHLNEFMSAHT